MRADYVIGIAILITIIIYYIFKASTGGEKMKDEEEDLEDEDSEDDESEEDTDDEESDEEDTEDDEDYQCTSCERDVEEGEYIELLDKDEDSSSFVFCKKCVDKAYPRDKGPSESEINILVHQGVQEILSKKLEKEPTTNIDESEFDVIL